MDKNIHTSYHYEIPLHTLTRNYKMYLRVLKMNRNPPVIWLNAIQNNVSRN